MTLRNVTRERASESNQYGGRRCSHVRARASRTYVHVPIYMLYTARRRAHDECRLSAVVGRPEMTTRAVRVLCSDSTGTVYTRIRANVYVYMVGVGEGGGSCGG